MLNLSAIMVLLSPILFYIHVGGTLFKSTQISTHIRPYVPPYLILTAICIGTTFLIPPLGFYRPHVYSDWFWNQPIQLQKHKKK